MKTCTFFGHSDTPVKVKPYMYKTVKDLIEKEGVELFYVGTHGMFDRMAYSVVEELQMLYPQIRCYRVLSRIPNVKDDDLEKNTIVPLGIETVPGRYSIVWRNRYMISQSEYVVTYVTHTWGGAAKFKNIAEKAGKRVIDLLQYIEE